MEFCHKMGPSTGLNDLFCKTVNILPGFHTSSQLQLRIQPDPIIRPTPPVRDPNYVQNFSAYERLMNEYIRYCNSVLARLPWSLVQQLQSVLNSAARLIFGLKRFDHITPALMDLHWLPYLQRITYKLCMIMFKCLRGSAPAYLADYCTSTSLVPGRSALRSAAHGDIVVPSYRTDWGLRSFAVAGPSYSHLTPHNLCLTNVCSKTLQFHTFCKILRF